MTGICMERRQGGVFLAIGLAFIGAGIAGTPGLTAAGLALLGVGAAHHIRWGRHRA